MVITKEEQDDAHIYCTEDQIETEVIAALNFMKDVYTTFGMTYKLDLSHSTTEGFRREAELWDKAEKSLANAMDEFAGKGGWRVNPGDGAFYGPKIDVKVMDAMEHVHQCAMTQLDSQLPIRFNLEYNTGSKKKGKEFACPVMIHHAMLGSIERMFAILCEHYGGKWPLWLSPRQKLHDERFYVDVDSSKNTFQKKARNAQVAQYNFQCVVGKDEAANGTVNIRIRENAVEGEMKVDDMIAMMKKL